MKTQFNDRLEFNATEKTAISVRDGVLEYRGSEIGAEPADKVFTVYRSAATIANVAPLMDGIQLTDDHVPLGSEIAAPVGSVGNSTMVDLFDHTLNSTLGIQNSIQVADEMLHALQEGKRELSLGYEAELIPHDKYDLEQRAIVPHHLAVVERGRCGPACSFLDRQKETKMKKVFLDADGNPNLEEIVKIAGQLPEALKKLPMDKLAEIMPILQEIVGIASASMAPEEETPPAEDMEMEKPEATDEEEKPPVEDMEMEEKKTLTDSAEFKDALDAALARHSEVVDKARTFLDEGYAFKGKDTATIMRDALAVEHGTQKFDDKELDVAFKLLKKTDSKYATFGDAHGDDAWSKTADKEL